MHGRGGLVVPSVLCQAHVQVMSTVRTILISVRSRYCAACVVSQRQCRGHSMGHCCCFTYSLVCSTDSLPRLVRLHSHVVLLTLSALGCDSERRINCLCAEKCDIMLQHGSSMRIAMCMLRVIGCVIFIIICSNIGTYSTGSMTDGPGGAEKAIEARTAHFRLFMH